MTDNKIQNKIVLDIGSIDDEKYKSCNFQTYTYEPSHKCNKFLLKKELIEANIENENEDNPLYPTLNDPNFSLKIANKQEFRDTVYDGDIYDIEERATMLANIGFDGLKPHQLFVKNFLSSHTPYNSLLLYHGLGTGKTCSAIGICEDHREYIKQGGTLKKIIVVASPNVQLNFRKQLFDENRIKKVNGFWTLPESCVGSKLINEINPTNMKDLEKSKVISQINKLINDSYQFMGYREFANYIEKKQIENVNQGQDYKDQIARMKRNIKSEFDNRLICIDEVHNVRTSLDDSENKKIAGQLAFMVKSTTHLRLLLLSGTPMFNSYKEIIWLLNLMNMNDNRGLIKTSDVFDKDGKFIEGGKDLLMRKANGYISYIRGENPYSFPYRIYPDLFDIEKTFQVVQRPTKTITNKPLKENEINTITSSNIFLVKTGEYQELAYQVLLKNVNIQNAKADNDDDNDIDNDNEESESKISYTKLQDPIQSLNISYPLQINYDSVVDAVDRGSVNIKEITGTKGLKNTMNYIDDRTDVMFKKGDFEYKKWVQTSEHANFLSPSKVGRYSGKLKQIADSILSSEGVILIYSQYLDGGLIPIALMLEEMGITRYGSKSKSLFKSPPYAQVNSKNLDKMDGSKDSTPAKYIMITGDKRLSSNNSEEISVATQKENTNGELVRVILVSMAGSEGVDLKFIRQVHILEPWFNMSRIEQIIGRAVRNDSHKNLPFKKRNVQIFMYSSLLSDLSQEAADTAIYRSAEFKALQIGRVTRILKEISVDCFLNYSQTNFSEEKMNQKVKQELSNGKIINDFSVGDKAFTMMTDFMEDGNYQCNNTKGIQMLSDIDLPVNTTTYDEKFIMHNTDKIVQKIKNLFRERFFYTKQDLFSLVNHPSVYPTPQIYSALTSLLNSDHEYIQDAYGRNGKLVNIGEYYLFQPIEIMNKNISLFDRSVPIPFKNDKIKINFNTNQQQQQQQALSPDINNPTTIIDKDDQIPVDIEENDINKLDVQQDVGEGNLQEVNVNTAVNIPQDTIEQLKDTEMIVPTTTVSEPQKIIRDIETLFNIAVSVYDINNPDIKRAEPELYKYFGSAMQRLRNANIVKDGSVSGLSQDEILKTILITHLVDHLQPKDKITLFRYLQNDSLDIVTNSEYFKNSLIEYFSRKIMRFTNSIGENMEAIAFYEQNGSKIYFVKQGESSWSNAEPEDIVDIDKFINSALKSQILSQVAPIIGFVGQGKIGEPTYKIKEVQNRTNNRSKGHRCEDKKRNDKLSVLQSLLFFGLSSQELTNVSEEERRNQVEFLMDSLKYKGKVTKSSKGDKSGNYIMQETCVFNEFISRYYNMVGMMNKKWFFDYEQYHMFKDTLNIV